MQITQKDNALNPNSYSDANKKTCFIAGLIE